MKVKLGISILFLLFGIMIMNYLCIYPEPYSLFDAFFQNLIYLLPSYTILVLVIVFLSFIPFKKLSFFKKFFYGIIFLNVLCLIFLFSFGFNKFYEHKQELDSSIRFYQNEAREDIRKDKIKEFAGGLRLPPKNKNESINFQKKDSIRMKYGIVISGSCIVSESMEILKDEYRKISEPYLEKRNGKNWKERMKQEIDAIK